MPNARFAARLPMILALLWGLTAAALAQTSDQPGASAAFSASPTSGPAPLTVQFANHSTGATVGYVWDFDGDGSPESTEAHPSWTFEAAGEYHARLVAAGAGGSSEATVVITVEAAADQPAAGFTASATDLNVVFQPETASQGATVFWDFGDGARSSSSNPTHTYQEPGVYIVTRTVSGPGGSASFSEAVAVSRQPPPLSASVGGIAFVSEREGAGEISLLSSDGGAARNLSDHPADDRHPAWSPDGRYLAFSSTRDGGDLDIYTLNLDTDEIARLTREGANSQPAWSPDGSRIAFVTDRFGDKDIMVMRADGSGKVQLTIDVSGDDQPAWSPDGAYIAYARGPAGERDIYVIRASDGENVIRLTKKAGDNADPAWLHDGARSLLAFTSTRTGNAEICLIDPATGDGLTRLTDHPAADREAAWSPDGSLLLFASERDEAGVSDLYTLDRRNGRVQRLAAGDGAGASEPAWR